ncbi:PP2C family serine/threonine-protein phosphatase [Pelagerythrobacter sp.]|uniref:PP2C family protein-serine/threonine phosphatase n=1 Tax=Pelagerythrobacter sp. TaxID=2800702 RepID=UPI0035B1E085
MNSLFRRFGPHSQAATGLRCNSTVRSHVGRVREVNEDRVLERPDVGLWAVADGMGGHSGGGEAAETLIAHLTRIPSPISMSAIDQALAAANAAILDASSGQSGTTAIVLHTEGPTAFLYWAGDSRAYLIREGALHLLTHDHSVVQQLIDAGALTPDEAAHHPQANVITNALGVGETLTIDRTSCHLLPGDRLLLCSDGLSRSLSDRDFTFVEPLAAQADRLLTNALQRDGSDNISLALVELRGGIAPQARTQGRRG